MDNEKIINDIFASLLLDLMELHEEYPVTLYTEFGEDKFTLIKTDKENIKIFPVEHTGNC